MRFLSALLFLHVAWSVCTPAAAAEPDGPVKVSVPTKTQVGAAAMPTEIAPVKAPFPIPEFKKPQFPALIVTITDHGAVENALATKAIQASIDDVSARGGGTVTVPPGKWSTGRIALKNDVNLQIAEGAELTFSGEIEDYLPAVFTRNEGVEVMSLGALIYANGQHHIAVTGKGKLIGPPLDCPVRKRVMNASVIENFIAAGTPVPERVYEGANGGPIFLPMFISPTDCTDVYIEGVTLERTPFWNIVPVYCDGVIIRGITVDSVGIPRGDGIDIESSRNVLIEYSTLSSGDDCFTLKAGRGDDGLRVNRPTENVVIRFCLARRGHGGVTLGSETAGMIRNVYVHDTVFDGTGTGLRFKTRRPRGGGGERMVFERIRMDLSGEAIVADMLGSRTYVGELADRLPARPIGRLTPKFEDVVVRDIIVERASQFLNIVGIPESPFTNLTVENADVHSRRLIRLSDAKDFTIRNARLQSADPTIALLDANGVAFENVTFDSPGGHLVAKLQGDATARIQFKDCTPSKPDDWDGNSR